MPSGPQLGSKYFLGEQIGRGAMGVVYDATTTDGGSLAVKLLRPELATDDKTVARFVQERQIFRRIEHPNVVRVDDLVAEGDQLGIAMEKVTGGDLKQRAEARSLAPAAAMRIAADVAAGLEAIHAADVVHRDLKPANILLAETPDGLQPKISDFGISRLVSEAMTRTSTTIGTPLYMAPEAADQRGADAPADVYSLGAMMFELLIGHAPFHQGGTFAVLRAHAQDPPARVGGVPVELADLIDHMLAKDPAARPTAGQVRQRLLALLPLIDDASAPVALPAPGSEPGAGGVGGGPGAAGAAAVGGAAIGGGAIGGAAAAAAGLGLAGGPASPSDSAETRISSDSHPLAGVAPGDSAEDPHLQRQPPPRRASTARPRPRNPRRTRRLGRDPHLQRRPPPRRAGTARPRPGPGALRGRRPGGAPGTGGRAGRPARPPAPSGQRDRPGPSPHWPRSSPWWPSW